MQKRKDYSIAMTTEIEIALLREDHTWDTDIVKIPYNDSEQSVEEAISAWFETTGSKKAEYRDVVQVALYNFSPGSRE